MGRPKTIKPYRVSYYFADAVDQGRVHLWTRIVSAYDVSDAKTQVVCIFKGAPGNLVIRNAYRFYRTYVPAKRWTFIKVTPTTFGGSTSSGTRTLSTSLTVGPVSTPMLTRLGLSGPPDVPPFKGDIDSRPVGACAMHPNAILEADGRCPALDYPPAFVATQPDLAAIVAKVTAPAADAPVNNPQEEVWGGYPDSYVSSCEDPVTCGSSEHGACEPCSTEEDPSWQPYNRVDPVTVGIKAEQEDSRTQNLDPLCSRLDPVYNPYPVTTVVLLGMVVLIAGGIVIALLLRGLHIIH
jgi:hypothetical protein